MRIVSTRPLASSLVSDRWPGVCRVSGATEEKIVCAIFEEGKSMDSRISDSLRVLDELRPRRVSSSCELVSAFSAVPDAHAPSLDGPKHASRTFVFSSKSSNYLYVLSTSDRSVPGAEAPCEPYLFPH